MIDIISVIYCDVLVGLKNKSGCFLFRHFSV